jgi:hypothetical protein
MRREEIVNHPPIIDCRCIRALSKLTIDSEIHKILSRRNDRNAASSTVFDAACDLFTRPKDDLTNAATRR